MPIHHAVLGLLSDGPSYGYEIKGAFEEAIGPQWGELNIGHVYQILDRLVREGYVTGRRLHQDDRPDRIVYRMTKEGRREFERWLRQPFVRRSGFRDEFFLKLFAASRLGPDRVREVARAQREVYLAELGSLEELKAQHSREPLVALLIEAATAHTEANLKVVEQAEERAGAIGAVEKTSRRRDERTAVGSQKRASR